jgi:hypothetical protein
LRQRQDVVEHPLLVKPVNPGVRVGPHLLFQGIGKSLTVRGQSHFPILPGAKEPAFAAEQVDSRLRARNHHHGSIRHKANSADGLGQAPIIDHFSAVLDVAKERSPILEP